MKRTYSVEGKNESKKDSKEEKKDDQLFSSESLSEYLNSMLEDKNKAVRVIASFFGTKGIGVSEGKIRVQKKQEIQALIRRHLRAANELVKGYPVEKIERTMDLLAEHADFGWELSTVLKYIGYSDDEIVKKLTRGKFVSVR